MKVVLTKPKILEKKLEPKTLGICHYDPPRIEIDPRQDSKEYMDTLIHEMLHHHFPKLSEKKVKKISKSLSSALWKKRYRRIEE